VTSILRFAFSHLCRVGLRFPALLESGLTRTGLQLTFSLLAPYYDQYGSSLGLLGNPNWDTVRDVLGEAPQDILDLSTGTGDCAFQMATVFPSARVTGVDISGQMLDAARRKAAEQHLEARVTFVNGDAAMLPFPDASFDLVVVQNAPIYVEEMVRVCKVGSVVAAGWALANYGIVAQTARRRFEIGGLGSIQTRPAGLGTVVSGVVP
jgi:ubiquinone/menaquinone biosynthesis C-methylase UbiE